MKRTNSRGFTVQAIVIGIATLGVVVACAAPAYMRYQESHELQGAADTVASQIRLARTIALSTGVDQPMVFETDSKGATFKTMNADGTVRTTGRLPNAIMYDGSTSRTFTLQSNGRADRSGLVVLCDYSGKCDTVSVERSGFILSH